MIAVYTFSPKERMHGIEYYVSHDFISLPDYDSVIEPKYSITSVFL